MSNECPNCKKIFSTKYNLATHLKKKNPCITKSDTFTCLRCQTKFNAKYNLERHKNKKTQCTIVIPVELLVAKEITKQEELKMKQEELKIKQEDLRNKRVDKQIALRKLDIRRDPNTYINILNMNFKHVKNIEDLRYTKIPLDVILRLQTISDRGECYRILLDIIFSNPENISAVYIDNLRGYNTMVKRKDEWHAENFQDVVPELSKATTNAAVNSQIMYEGIDKLKYSKYLEKMLDSNMPLDILEEYILANSANKTEIETLLIQGCKDYQELQMI